MIRHVSGNKTYMVDNSGVAYRALYCNRRPNHEVVVPITDNRDRIYHSGFSYSATTATRIQITATRLSPANCYHRPFKTQHCL